MAPASSTRRYRPDTNIHETEFVTATGPVRIVDFMPLGRSDGAAAHDYVSVRGPHWLVRRVEVLEGAVEMATGLPGCSLPCPLQVAGGRAHGRFHLRAGDTARFVLAASHVAGATPLDRVDEFEAVAQAFWCELIAYCRYAGPRADLVRRSALVLKRMSHSASGALAAALTTSLPQASRSARNRDDRFSWLRNSCFTLYALAVLGYGGEARAYVAYLARCMRGTLPEVQIM